ncbi:MAG: DUF1127 domain-containing protein [Phyllobacteriaceae bacterium]|jgi:uncharacterized protein YjiS (DUF1127 family)|nr:DUF1127 domain-containing protein [Phyllobacteriaceae bacterium]
MTMFVDETQIGTAKTGAAQSGDWLEFLAALSSRLAVAARRRTTRRHLAALDDDQLADVGITRGQALREVRRSFPFFGP